MRKPIYIFGAGGFGREVRSLIARLPDWQVVGFYDDGVPAGTSVDGIECLGSLEQLLSNHTARVSMVIGVGDPAVKRRIVERLHEARHLDFPVLIDPGAIVLDPQRVALGAGSIITAGAVLTTGITIGKHCLINLNVTIGHDTRMGDSCSLMPGTNLAGSVVLGDGVLVGSGSSLLNGVQVGEGARVGAGSVVLHNVTANTTVMGVPAKEKK